MVYIIIVNGCYKPTYSVWRPHLVALVGSLYELGKKLYNCAYVTYLLVELLRPQKASFSMFGVFADQRGKSSRQITTSSHPLDIKVLQMEPQKD